MGQGFGRLRKASEKMQRVFSGVLQSYLKTSRAGYLEIRQGSKTGSHDKLRCFVVLYSDMRW